MQAAIVNNLNRARIHRQWRYNTTAGPTTSNTSIRSSSFPLRMIRRAGSIGKNTLSLVGIGTVAYFVYDYKQQRDIAKAFNDDDDDAKEKKVLVLPFHRMNLVERKKDISSFDDFVLENLMSSDDDDDKRITVEVRELVDVIHAASHDSNIVALYGTFGNGVGVANVGLGHIEEIRNALKVWRESHRFHLEPNLKYEKTILRSNQGIPKPSFAYADSFMFSSNNGNKDYLLACAFSHLHMQKHGELMLAGTFRTNNFYRSFLDRYGIKVHSFKHGKFKTAPNAFTERDYTPEHGRSERKMVDQMDAYEREGIVNGRGAKGFDSMVWKMIRKHGTFTGDQARKLGLLDHLSKLNPLEKLLLYNTKFKSTDDKEENKKIEEQKRKFKEEIGNETDLSAFTATSKISYEKYRNLLHKRKRMERRKQRFNSTLKSLTNRSSAFEALLYNVLGYKETLLQQNEEVEKIAVLDISGTITDAVASKTVASLRKIKKDPKVKAVVLRINSPGGSVFASEYILQECKDIPQPIICSMSNVCASGGYWIATCADRIFAVPTTVTGSIGVFGIRPDFTGLARKYGIHARSVLTGPHSATFDLLQPLNDVMISNFKKNVLRQYDNFLNLVAKGRGMSVRDVDTIAQGKIWTGREAKENGLIDELGGLYRAIEYAKRTYCTNTGSDNNNRDEDNDNILIDRYPKSGSHPIVKLFKSTFASSSPEQDTNKISMETFFQGIISNPDKYIHALQQSNGIYLTMDETSALSQLIEDTIAKSNMNDILHPQSSSSFYSSFWR